MPPTVWSLWHFQTDTLEWGMEDDELPHLLIGRFSARATAEELRTRLGTWPGFRAWPQGFRIFRRRLGVAFGLDGFRKRYGWEAWRDPLRG